MTINQTGSGNILNLQGSGNTLFTVTNTGNVGIGTTSPFSKLSIVGDIYASSTGTSTFTGGVSVVATTTVTLPEWTGYSKASSEEQTKWNAFVTKVRTHEEGHVAIDTRGAYAIARAYASSARSRAELIRNQTQNYNREFANIKAENHEYDRVHFDVNH